MGISYELEHLTSPSPLGSFAGSFAKVFGDGKGVPSPIRTSDTSSSLRNSVMYDVHSSILAFTFSGIFCSHDYRHYPKDPSGEGDHDGGETHYRLGLGFNPNGSTSFDGFRIKLIGISSLIHTEIYSIVVFVGKDRWSAQCSGQSSIDCR